MATRHTERAAALVTGWARCYTRRLPPPVAGRRVGEISADLHDHITYERSRGTGDRRIALGLLSRLVRGLAADVSWRSRIRPWSRDIVKSFAAVLAAALALIAVGLLAVLYGSGDDSPGLVLIGVLLIVGAFALAVRSAHRRGRGIGTS